MPNENENDRPISPDIDVSQYTTNQFLEFHYGTFNTTDEIGDILNRLVETAPPLKKVKKMKNKKKMKQFKNSTPEPAYMDGLKIINIHKHLVDNIPAASRLLETTIFPRIGKGNGICLRFRPSVVSAKRDRLHMFLKDLVDFSYSNKIKSKILVLSTSSSLVESLKIMFGKSLPFETKIIKSPQKAFAELPKQVYGPEDGGSDALPSRNY